MAINRIDPLGERAEHLAKSEPQLKSFAPPLNPDFEELHDAIEGVKRGFFCKDVDEQTGGIAGSVFRAISESKSCKTR